MHFLPAVDLWIANELPLEQALPVAIEQEDSAAPVLPVEVNEDSSEPAFSLEATLEIKPFVLEGSVESFDPVARASELVKTMQGKWCGVYRPFKTDSEIDVVLTFQRITAIGQIIDLRGEMLLGKTQIPVNGHFNAKSDQVELIPISDQVINGLEPGGIFVGLQGFSLFGWKSPRLDNPGGRLSLNQDCGQQISKAPAVLGLW